MGEEELDLLDKINSMGIGPMGMGGDTTALAVHINKAHCHTASLPVAINIQCWANRHSTAVFQGGSHMEYHLTTPLFRDDIIDPEMWGCCLSFRHNPDSP